MQPKANILDVCQPYDTLLVDMYGVLDNGIVAFDGVPETLIQLRKSGKRIVILSNSTRTELQELFSKKGLIQNIHYDLAISSGVFLNYLLTQDPAKFNNFMKLPKPAKTFKAICQLHKSLFAGSSLTEAQDYESADFIYAGFPQFNDSPILITDLFENDVQVPIEEITARDWSKIQTASSTYPLRSIHDILTKCVSLNKPLLVANPDIFANGITASGTSTISFLTPGAIGAKYQNMGGRVVFFGKPYQDIYEFAFSIVQREEEKKRKEEGTSEEHSPTAQDLKSRIAMVGDTPWTDVLGGKRFGLDTIMCLTGVPEAFFEQMDATSSSPLSLDSKLKCLLTSIAPKMSGCTEDMTPTYIISKFA